MTQHTECHQEQRLCKLEFQVSDMERVKKDLSQIKKIMWVIAGIMIAQNDLISTAVKAMLK
jgi:hypothetical protein